MCPSDDNYVFSFEDMWTSPPKVLLPDSPFCREGNVACGIYNRFTSATHDWYPEEGEVISSDEDGSHTFSVKKEEILYKCPHPECRQEFSSMQFQNMHYSAVHRHVCLECKKVLPSEFLLDVHINESHDPFFDITSQKKDMYRCLVESCTDKFKDSELRRTHMIKTHQYPANYRFMNSRTKVNRKNKKKDDCSKMLVDSDDLPATKDSQSASSANDSQSATSANDSQSASSAKDSQSASSAKDSQTARFPRQINFGKGSHKSFQTRKHWHQQAAKPNTEVSVEEVDMGELAEALE